MLSSPTTNIPFLPPEIWIRILKNLHRVSPSTVKSVALVDRRLHDIAVSILFRSVCLDFNLPRHRWFMDYKKVPWHYVKVITMVSELYWYKDDLLKILESATSLQQFYWRNGVFIPGHILYTIHRLYPHVSVHITGENVCILQRRRSHQSIQRSIPHLQSIRYLSSHWRGKKWDDQSKTFTSRSHLARLKDMICASRNLETLKLSQHREHPSSHGGIIVLQKGDTMPRLKYLHLSNMHFDTSQSILWAEGLQWELLHSLSLLNGNWSDLAPLITGRLRNLKSLEVSISCWNSHPNFRHASSKFPKSPVYWDRVTQARILLESFSTLETFSGYYLPQDILNTLSSHHPLLRHLRFRSFNRQRDESAWNPFPPSIEDLVSLPTKFPNLRSLGLDLDWENEEWPYEIMIGIRRIKHLQHLEINIPGVHQYQERNPRPVYATVPNKPIEESACLRLLQFLESDSGCDPLFLRSLHIRMGEWERNKWSLYTSNHTTGPLVIGERTITGKMHFDYFPPPQIRWYDKVQSPPRDEYRNILEVYGLDSPFIRDSGSLAYAPFN